MSEREAIDALRHVGFSNYEAQVFVALQQLGGGTAQDVSQLSDVPRSQVYGTADDLAERGFVEVVETTPKAYHPVALSTTREILSDRFEEELSRAFDNLESISARETDRANDGNVSVLRGRQPINDRITTLIRAADHTVIYVAPKASSMTPAIGDTLCEAAGDNIEVSVVTADDSLEARFADDPVHVFVMSADNPADFAGRALMVDDRTVLLAATTENEPRAEEALWSGDSSIGRILAAFMRSGMESGRKRQAD